jgi:hypothetical protein
MSDKVSVLEELQRSVEDHFFFDDLASSDTYNVFFSARSFHGLADDDWRDVYSYAMEAAAALGL